MSRNARSRRWKARHPSKGGRDPKAPLEWLSEVFEVRESLAASAADEAWAAFWGPYVDKLPDIDVGTWSYDDMLTQAAERLHAAGWRPGMTAEDAARLLAEWASGR